jgi:hypothetical protein
MKNRDIDECNFDLLRMDFSELGAKYQHGHLKVDDEYSAGIEESNTRDFRNFFRYVDLIKKSVGYIFRL